MMGVRRVIGLMSGTSADGVDVALVRIEGAYPLPAVLCERVVHLPYPSALRLAVHAAHSRPLADAWALSQELAEVWAAAVTRLLEQALIDPLDVRAIGCSGQTVWHDAASTPVRSVQLGHAPLLAELTGIPVVHDLRQTDIAAGGAGAPLVPFADAVMFGVPTGLRLLLNLGGIGNLTVLTDGAAWGFDVGPGNMALDALCRELDPDGPGYDRDGALAASGCVDAGLLERALAHPFFATPPPRSAGRREFGQAWVVGLVAGRQSGLPDLLATFAAVTIECIARALESFVPDWRTAEGLVVAGGGAANPILMKGLSERLAPLGVVTSQVLGVPPDAREAMAMAILADASLIGVAANRAGSTGAAVERPLGSVTLWPRR